MGDRDRNTMAARAEQMQEWDIAAHARGVLDAHRYMNFVQRALNPKAWPKQDNGDGTYSTHLMSWDTDKHGNAWVYPTIVYEQKTGKLVRFDPRSRAAWDYAAKTGERIPFGKDYKGAEIFSDKGYKLGAGIIAPGDAIDQE